MRHPTQSTPIITGRFGYNAQSDDMRTMLGLPPKAKLPAEGMLPRDIQGFSVYVAPLDPARRRRRGHRVRAICPRCHVDISAGRVMQHMAVHEPGSDRWPRRRAEALAAANRPPVTPNEQESDHA
jgi:hypothetical protein